MYIAHTIIYYYYFAHIPLYIHLSMITISLRHFAEMVMKRNILKMFSSCYDFKSMQFYILCNRR